MSNDAENLCLDSIFTEPLRPPTPEPTYATFVRDPKNIRDQNDRSEIRIRLVGSHPLWGHYLWNASRAFASYLDSNRQLYEDRNVLELGVGAALPSIVAANNGAKRVVITDYPDTALVENISHNIECNVSKIRQQYIHVQGYIWGHVVKPLLDALSESPSHKKSGFDLIILSDLIFNHSQHEALLNTCELVLANENPNGSGQPKDASTSGSCTLPPCVLVFYTHHRPHLAHRDMNFFDKARKMGWKCEEILTETYPPMFPDDSGEESIRSTVHGFRLTRS